MAGAPQKLQAAIRGAVAFPRVATRSAAAVRVEAGRSVPQFGKGSRYNRSVPVTLAIDPEGRFVIMTLTDPYSIEEWRGGVLVVLALPSLPTPPPLLINRRQCEPPTPAVRPPIIAIFFHPPSLIA